MADNLAAELMSRDPLLLTKDDIKIIVEEYRKSRKNFNAGNMFAGSTKKKSPAQKQVESLANKLDIKL